MAGMNASRSRILAGGTIGLLAALIAIALWSGGLLRSWEAATYDLRVRLMAAPSPATDDIRIILLDQPSLDWTQAEFGLGWPWPRQVYAPIVDFCRRAGAKSLAFDVVYTEPSVYGVSDDQTLGSAIKANGHVVMPVDLYLTDGSDAYWPDSAPKPQHAIDGFETWANDLDLKKNMATFPIPEIAQNAALLGNVNNAPDADTVFRSVAPLLIFDGQHVPTLPLAAYLAAHPQAKLGMKGDALLVDGKTVPLGEKGKALLNYRGNTDVYAPVSAAAIIQSELRLAEGKEPVIAPADFKGKYVFFGFSATGLLDLRPSPMGGVTPGVVINATLLDNLLANDFLRMLPHWASILGMLLIGLSAGLAHMLVKRVPTMVMVTAGAFLIPTAAAFILYEQGFWAPLVAPLLTATMALGGTGLLKYATEGRQRRFIKSAFKHYLSPQVIEQLMENPERLQLGGERREISIFFSDIQGFTTISESMEPEELTAVLNDYLTAMTDIIQAEGGTVDKYEGDAIIAFWNAPVDQPGHARHAVHAALACQKKLDDMRAELKERTGHEFHMRIGVNTGPAVVGNLGSHSRFDYTMLGDAVNLAARLEGANKQFGTYTMISKATLDQVDALDNEPDEKNAAYETVVPRRELARLQVVGKNIPVTVYEPMLAATAKDKAEQTITFAEGLKAFYAGDFALAQTTFSSIAGTDPAAAQYAKRCEMMTAMGKTPENWAGVWTLTSK